MKQSQKPKQYAMGYTEFYKLKFILNPNVLIPRPETELLVDNVLKISNILHNQPLTIIDIGTGSGCISVSIAKNLSMAQVLALDISEKALELAELNAKLHGVEDQIFFLKSDLLLGLDKHRKTPNIIVANLPYIPDWKIPKLDESVVDFEPRIALDGGIDGFDLYRRLFAQMKQKNIIPEYMICEIDEDQGKLALEETKKFFLQTTVEIKKDLYQKDRILFIKFLNAKRVKLKY